MKITTKDFLISPPNKPVLYPDPVLLQVAEPIMDLEPWKEIAPIMFDIMKNHAGCGLAAPQVGLSYRMFIIETTTQMVVINPEILSFGKRITSVEEGCLSLPGYKTLVTRPSKIKVKWMDLEGNSKIALFEGLTSRVFQHEIDHLFGTMINNKAQLKLGS